MSNKKRKRALAKQRAVLEAQQRKAEKGEPAKKKHKGAANMSNSPGAVFDEPHDLWFVAASVLQRVLRGGSLKSLLASLKSDQARPVNALVTETLKKRDLLDRAVGKSGPWTVQTEKAHTLRLLLAHEMLFGHGLHQSALRVPSTRPVFAEALERMRLYQARLLKEAKEHSAAGSTAGSGGGGGGGDSATDGELAAADEPAEREEVLTLPRYARVNTLVTSVEAAVASLSSLGWQVVAAPVRTLRRTRHGVRVVSVAAAAPKPCTLWLDPHVPSLLVLPPYAELHQHSMVLANSALILQDKASCLAPAALAPRPGELILDCCAAPNTCPPPDMGAATDGGITTDAGRIGVDAGTGPSGSGGCSASGPTNGHGPAPGAPLLFGLLALRRGRRARGA